MPCYYPLQASFYVNDFGKKKLTFNTPRANAAAKAFVEGRTFDKNGIITLPCGRCMGCRLEKSRQWALRCMHEASLYEKNCFITLTYDNSCLPFAGTLVKKDFQDFMKRLRSRYHDKIRFFACGEYGDSLGRPHYHACLFNCDFDDKMLFKSIDSGNLYTSRLLSDCWGLGFCTLGDCTFESAAYVARYCTKKITGDAAVEHYQGKLPEFALMSLKPGIGYGWYQKYKFDCYPSDFLVVNGVKCKPPRYYDKKFKESHPDLFEDIKLTRVEKASLSEDSSFSRLRVREICQKSRFKKLIRKFEIGE